MATASNAFRFEELRVYQEALIFIDFVYSLFHKFPREELFGLTDQLRRASVSVALNIAEGSSRTKKDFSHFLDLSRGSCYECVAITTVAKNRKFLSLEEYSKVYEWCNKLARMINALKRSLQSTVN